LTANVFGTSAVAFKASTSAGDGDFGPRLKLSIGKYEENEAPYIPNPKYLGKALLIENISVSSVPNKEQGGEKQVIDAAKITVVETGEVFERQRIFQVGVVRQLVGLAGQTVVAGVGTYTSEKRGGQSFVQLVDPTVEQQAAANALLAGKAAGGSDAPF